MPQGFERLWGTDTLPCDVGVLHVVAVWAESATQYRVMKIGESSPKSANDFFALDVSRARADVIITTGKILREEPELRYDLRSEAADALHDWRREQGRTEPPWVIVLTSGRGIDPDHPAFHSWARPLVFTSESGADTLAGSGLDVVTLSAPNVRKAVAYARTELAAKTASIEAGPSTALDLYASPCRVDELMLSVFEGPGLAESACGRSFLPQKQLESDFERISRCVMAEPSGPWRFERWRRSR